jgi:hypothetical protein
MIAITSARLERNVTGAVLLAQLLESAARSEDQMQAEPTMSKQILLAHDYWQSLIPRYSLEVFRSN